MSKLRVGRFYVVDDLTMSNEYLRIVDELLTPADCTRFRTLFETQTVQHVDSPLASYDRTILVDAALAATLFGRIRHLLPPDPTIVGCNDHFRLSRYQPGEEFKKHADGINQDKYGNRSRFTVNIFLNDDFTGGETEFWVQGAGHKVAYPKTGRGAIFSRETLHCENRVLTGQKFLIRTDVMVRDGL